MTTKDTTEVKKTRATQKHRGHGEGSIYQRGDGRWTSCLSLPNGKRKYYAGKSKQEVKAKLKAAQAQLEQGTLVTAPQESFEAYMQYRLTIKKLDLKVGSYCCYQNNVQNNILPTLGRIRLQKLSFEHIQLLYTDLLHTGHSANTVRIIHVILKGALNAAVKWQKISVNPCNLVTPPRATKKEVGFLTQEQAQRLLDAAKSHRLEGLLALALATGMRKGELLALQWSDIDFEQATIRVARSLSYRNPDREGYQFEEVEPKTTSSKRRIALPQFAIDILRKHHQQHAEERSKASIWEEKGLVFPNSKGKYYSSTTLRKQFTRLLQDASLPAIRFHDVRRFGDCKIAPKGQKVRAITF